MLWEQKLKHSETKASRSRSHRRRRRQRREGRDSTSNNTGTIHDGKLKHSKRSSSHQSSSVSKRQQSFSKRVRKQSLLPSHPNPPSIAVRIPHHSSLDEDHYVLYHSSSSFPGSLYKSVHRSDSISVVSSRQITTLQLCETQGDGVVPDSQSLPGSSSYVPSSTFSSKSSSKRPTRALDGLTPFNFESSARTSTSGEDSSINAIACSTQIISDSQRSQTAPLQNSEERLLLLNHLRLLPRGLSDPTPGELSHPPRQTLPYQNEPHLVKPGIVVPDSTLQSSVSGITSGGHKFRKGTISEAQVSLASTSQEFGVSDSFASKKPTK